MTALRSSSFSIQVISASRVAGVRPRHSGRRHHPGAKFPDDFFADLRMVAEVRQVQLVEQQVGRLQLCVVAAHAILVDDRALGGCVGGKLRRRCRGGLAGGRRTHRGAAQAIMKPISRSLLFTDSPPVAVGFIELSLS